MKNDETHHAKRLAKRMLQAELCVDPERAEHILHKAGKHKRALKKLRDQRSAANQDQTD